MEETTKCKLLVLTHNGSKSLSSLMLISATSKKQENVLMSIQTDEEGREVIAWNKHGGANQRWKVVYQDEHEKI
jgi:hypothetical protein